MTSLAADGLPPATGAWREGDPPGRRQWFLAPGPLMLDRGASLSGYRIAYETWGTLAADRSNAVLVLHALTGDSHVSGESEPGHPTPGWWDGLIGPGRALDPRHHYIVAPNVLGGCQGTTGPASTAPDGRPWGGRFPGLTIRDTVAAEALLADDLGIDSWALVLGGSMGGMRALEWAVMCPDRVRGLLVLSAAAEAHADQIAWTRAQIAAITEDAAWNGGDYHLSPGGGPRAGLGVARRIAHTTYRSAAELTSRFGRTAQQGEDPRGSGRFAVESYLDYHAGKLVDRFDPASYVLLSQAMNLHDVWHGRDTTALDRVTANVLVAGVDTDRLYPWEQQHRLAELLGRPDALRMISSAHGHDGFLVEVDQVSALITELLDRRER